IYPAFGCGDTNINMYLYFQRVAAHYGKLLNTGYTARPIANCENNERVFEEAFRQGDLTIMRHPGNPFMMPDAIVRASQYGACVQWQDVVLCKTEADQSYWERSGLQIKAIVLTNLSKVTWSADRLPSQIGTVVNGRLVPAQKDKAGCLS